MKIDSLETANLVWQRLKRAEEMRSSLRAGQAVYLVVDDPKDAMTEVPDPHVRVSVDAADAFLSREIASCVTRLQGLGVEFP